MTNKKANANDTLLEFPCQFPLKVFGLTHDSFELTVVSIINNHLPDPQKLDISHKPSKNGKYTSLTVRFTAHSKQQLNAIYQELTDHPAVVMTL